MRVRVRVRVRVEEEVAEMCDNPHSSSPFASPGQEVKNNREKVAGRSDRWGGNVFKISGYFPLS